MGGGERVQMPLLPTFVVQRVFRTSSYMTTSCCMSLLRVWTGVIGMLL